MNESLDQHHEAKAEEDEEVPSATSLDTRIFNTDNNSVAESTCTNNSGNNSFSFINHQQKAVNSDTSRPIKNEKSIQDSLEYLYEQNNNFINEISNINQLMDTKNSTSSGNNNNHMANNPSNLENNFNSSNNRFSVGNQQ